jgi:hypothetical protein
MNFKVTLFQSWGDIQNIRNIVDNISLRSGNYSFFQSYSWMNTWWNCFGKDKELFFLLIEKDDIPVSFAPLCIDKVNIWGFSTKIMHFIGDYLSGYGDFVITSDHKETMELIFKFLQKYQYSWDWLQLLHVAEDSSNWDCLVTTGTDFGLIPSVKLCPGYFFVRIDKTFDDYFSSLTKNHRHKYRQKEKRLQKIGRLELSIIDYNNPELIKHYEDFWLIRKARLESLGKWQATNDQEYHQKSFFWHLLKDPETSNVVKLFILFFEEKPIAYLIGIISDAKLYLYLIAFSSEFTPYSPGIVLYKYLINYAFNNTLEQGFKEVDLLIGDTPYKSGWGKESRKVHDLFLFPRTIRGYLLYKWLGQIKPSLKQQAWLQNLRGRLKKVKEVLGARKAA